jgi:peptidoglycan/xylan/chitin deacetylase (PgdA/CDA1 family)
VRRKTVAFILFIVFTSVVLAAGFILPLSSSRAINRIDTPSDPKKQLTTIEDTDKEEFAANYNKAVECIENGEYLGALNMLESIPARNGAVRSRMKSSLLLYMEETAELADRYVTEKKYKEALDCLDSISEIGAGYSALISSDKRLSAVSSDAAEKTRLLNMSINLKKSYPVTILMYHSISNQPGNDLCIPPEKFRSQMKYLKEKKYNVIHFDDLYWYFSKDVPIPPNTVIVTLDDGYRDNYTDAYPILKELELKATVFVITSTIDKHSFYLNSEQIKEMDEHNVRIESHTANHDADKKLATLSYKTQLQSFKESKEVLENILGREVRYICYPFGSYNRDTVKAAQEAGYKIGVTIESGRADKSNGLLTLRRIYIGNKYSMEVFKQLVR